MKRQLISLFFFLFVVPFLWETTGCKKNPEPSPVALKTFKGFFRPLSLAEITQFADSNYQMIDGSLFLDGISGLKDLTAFSSLKKVTGAVLIAHDSDLLSVQGMENLETIGWDLQISENINLRTITAFDKLTSTGGIEILGNPRLTRVVFNKVNKATKFLEFLNNQELQSITGMNGVTSTGFFIVSGNPALKKIDAFKNLKTVTRNFFFDHNDLLTNLDWAGQIQSVTGLASIDDNPLLLNLDGLKNLETVGAGLLVSFNPKLQNLDGLQKLRAVGGGMVIQVNPALEDLQGLHSLNTVKDNFTIIGNNRISRLDGLENLRSVYRLSITYNDSLYNFCALKGLLMLGTVDTLTIQGNLANPTANEIKQKSCSN